MRSIGVLNGMRKGKPCHDRRPCRTGNRLAFGCALLTALLYCAVPGSAVAGEKDVTLSTRQNESVIGKDPVTGDRVMQTPDPRPREEYTGPQTVIVAPEVNPGRTRGSGDSPPSRFQPRQ